MQETAASVLMGMVALGVLLALCYLYMLTSFFKELRHREPELWRGIGSPGLLNMLLLPFINFRKFYAFLPHLKARRHSDYRYARAAWNMLRVGLGYVALLFLLTAWLAVSVLSE